MPGLFPFPVLHGAAMSDEPSSSEAGGDPTTVNISEPWTRAYWARRFEVPVERLEAAVEAVGPEPAKVAAELGLPWPFEKTGIV